MVFYYMKETKRKFPCWSILPLHFITHKAILIFLKVNYYIYLILVKHQWDRLLPISPSLCSLKVITSSYIGCKISKWWDQVAQGLLNPTLVVFAQLHVLATCSHLYFSSGHSNTWAVIQTSGAGSRVYFYWFLKLVVLRCYNVW